RTGTLPATEIDHADPHQLLRLGLTSATAAGADLQRGVLCFGSGCRQDVLVVPEEIAGVVFLLYPGQSRVVRAIGRADNVRPVFGLAADCVHVDATRRVGRERLAHPPSPGEMGR